MKILTTRDAPGVQQAGSYRKFIERLAFSNWGKGVAVSWAIGGRPIAACIVGSKWAVQCDVCFDANPADPERPEPYFCPKCLNQRDDGLARPVVFPDAVLRARIEKVLLKRANPNERNWRPGETLDGLIIENLEHGEPVPEV